MVLVAKNIFRVFITCIKERGISMRVNFNPSVNQVTPSFKAKFANDVQTVGILKKLAKKQPIETILSIDLLKEAGTNDIISLKNPEIRRLPIIKIINETLYPTLGSEVKINYRDFFYGIQRVFLSNNTYAGSAIFKIKKVEDFADQRIVQKKIEVNNLQNQLIMLETEKLENDSKIAIEYIDNNI